MFRFVFALATLIVSTFAASLMFANIVLGCETFDRELWTPESQCVSPTDVF